MVNSNIMNLCIEKCQKTMNKNTPTNKIILYNFFIETWGNMAINNINPIIQKLDIISKFQNNKGKIPSEITYFICVHIPHYNNSVLMNAIYIIILYTVDKILLEHNILDKYSNQLLNAINYLNSHYLKNSDCFQNFFVLQALTYVNDFYKNNFYKNDFNLEKPTINHKINTLNKIINQNFWSTEKKNLNVFSFALLFNLVDEDTKNKIIKDRVLLLNCKSNLNMQLLFLLSCVKWTSLEWIENELTKLEMIIIMREKKDLTICSLYITCRLTLEKEKILRKN